MVSSVKSNIKSNIKMRLASACFGTAAFAFLDVLVNKANKNLIFQKI